MPLRDKFKIRCRVKWKPLLFDFMLKQGMTWFPLATKDSLETVWQLQGIIPDIGMQTSQAMLSFYLAFWNVPSPRTLLT